MVSDVQLRLIHAAEVALAAVAQHGDNGVPRPQVPRRAHGADAVERGGAADEEPLLVEEVLGPDIALLPTYGNTLMGLAIGLPVGPEAGYQPRYYAPEPRAVLRVVDPADPERLVDHGAWGQIELTTLTRELFLPRHLERDEGLRLAPCERYPWDGVGEVRPLGTGQGTGSVEGVY